MGSPEPRTSVCTTTCVLPATGSVFVISTFWSFTCCSAPEYRRSSRTLNSVCSLPRCSGVAPRHCTPTAERVATSKFTLGMTLLSTSAEMRPKSPAWMALSALAASMTSTEICLTSASGATSACAVAVAAMPSSSDSEQSIFFSMFFLPRGGEWAAHP